jgi:hypothetical protein
MKLDLVHSSNKNDKIICCLKKKRNANYKKDGYNVLSEILSKMDMP